MKLHLNSNTPIVIGVVHLAPLMGSPKFAGDPKVVIKSAVDDAKALFDGGVDAIIVENFGDQPFFRDRCPDLSYASFLRCVSEVQRVVSIPIGVNFLRNAGEQAMAAALALEAAFIRVNVLVGARVTDQGLIEGRAAEILRLRQYHNPSVKVFADIAVKHSAPLGDRPLVEEAREALGRGGADGIIISGSGTGAAADLNELAELRSAGIGPVLIGSGVNISNIDEYLKVSDGVIVGTSVKKDGDISAPVDVSRVKTIVDRCRG